MSRQLSRFSLKQFLLTLIFATVLWMLVAWLCTMVGTTSDLSLKMMEVRLFDHVLPASLVGAALAASGVVYQAVLRNPLADPYLLGVSSGATLASYLWYVPAVASILPVGVVSPQVFAFIGALVSMGVVFALAGKRGRMEPVAAVLVGAIVNSVCGALFMLLNTLDRSIATRGGLQMFLIGDLQKNVQPQQYIISFVIILIGVLVMMLIASSLNIIRLSEDEAQSVGVRVHRTRWIGIVAASIVTAAAVAISGPIGFVGLICPHLVRRLIGNDNRKVLPAAIALGACLLCVADGLARWLAQESLLNTRLPVGIFMALLGGPAFLLIFGRNRGQSV